MGWGVAGLRISILIWVGARVGCGYVLVWREASLIEQLRERRDAACLADGLAVRLVDRQVPQRGGGALLREEVAL